MRVRAESVCARAQSVHATGKLMHGTPHSHGVGVPTNDLNVEGGLFSESYLSTAILNNCPRVRAAPCFFDRVLS